MKVEQALVAVGGGASRLKADGIEVPTSKSFLSLHEKPLLEWCLTSLYVAGIKKVVLAGNTEGCLAKAEEVVSNLSHGFKEIEYFQDSGSGFHALPYHARHLLDADFFFECGHAISKPSHYLQMESLKNPENVVFSTYRSHPRNPRMPIIIEDHRAILPEDTKATGFALATPLLIDQAYADKLPSLAFNIRTIIGHYSTVSQLECVVSDMPPEFDIAEEYEATQVAYEGLINELGKTT